MECAHLAWRERRFVIVVTVGQTLTCAQGKPRMQPLPKNYATSPLAPIQGYLILTKVA